jgi:Cu/Ag efflux protein CusF
MKKFLYTVAAIAVVMAVTLPVRAQDAAKPEKPKKHEFTGEITKIDVATKAVTAKNAKDEEKIFTADKAKIHTKGKEASELSDLKVGDKVTVSYTEEGGKNVAHRIAPPDASKKKDTKPATTP